VAGNSNHVGGDEAMSAAGRANVVDGNLGLAAGGNQNTVAAVRSFSGTDSTSVVLGGSSNTVTNYGNVLIGGTCDVLGLTATDSDRDAAVSNGASSLNSIRLVERGPPELELRDSRRSSGRVLQHGKRLGRKRRGNRKHAVRRLSQRARRVGRLMFKHTCSIRTYLE
jgi:hypothetical protein